jgi:hypothetical protein
LLLPPLALATTGPRYTFEAGGGLFTPYGGSERDAFAPAGVVNLGFAAELNRQVWLAVDVGMFRASGEEFFDDPTFNLPESKYSGYPVTLGLRFNTSATGEERPVRLYLGLGARTVFTRYRRSFEDELTAPLVGFVAEFRPEVRLRGRTSLYLRQRVAFMGNTDYGNRTRNVGFSGSTLDLGLTMGVGPGQSPGGGTER